MNRFLSNEISEKELFNLTPVDATYEVIYLCSALVLEEYRRKGITKNLTLTAIAKIREKHTLKAALVWAFSTEGDCAAESIAKSSGLPLFKFAM
jgi:predicted GNAT family acetyltransferase